MSDGFLDLTDIGPKPVTPTEPIAPMEPAEPEIPAGVQLRRIDDASATRRAVFDGALRAVQSIQPLENTRFRLELADPHYADTDYVNTRDQKKAILGGSSIHRRLRGTVRLIDKGTGSLVDERKLTLANIPYLTNRGTFIQRGTDYSLATQLRLRPGIFSRVKSNGEFEAHVNTLPGKGFSHRIFMDPETGVFRIGVDQAKLPLMPVLRAMGVTDTQLKEAWGSDLAGINATYDDPAALKRIYRRIKRGSGDAPDADMRKAVADAFNAMELDPDVTEQTLKQRFPKLTPDALIATTKKLLAMSRGEDEADDRDNLAFQAVFGPEDTIAERLSRDKNTLRKILWRATALGNLSRVPTAPLDHAIQSAIFDSGLGSPLEEVNTAELLDQQSRITRMGVGAMSSTDAIPDEARSVQPSQYGFIDFLRTPESSKVGVEGRISGAAMKGSDGRLYAPFIDPKTGKRVYRSPQDLLGKTIAFPGELESGEPAVKAIKNGQLTYVLPDEVDYHPISNSDAFSAMAQMVPLTSSVKGQRAVMASRMITQALPIERPEAPLVQAGVPGQTDKSYEQLFGKHMGAVFAEQPGRVVSVAPDEIVVKLADGSKKSYDLYDSMVFNRKTRLHNTPAVQVGDDVKPGQLLARSNFTDEQGTTALGSNAYVAYVPYLGHNYEDAITISESYAQRMASEQAYQHDTPFDPGTKPGKRDFMAIFPTRFTRQQLETVDNNGVVKPGTTVQTGDPLILLAKEREPAGGKVHRGHKPTFTDQAVTWEHHRPGLVTDIVFNNKGANVVVVSSTPMQEGDKLSGRYGDKGVVKVIPDDQMPHDKAGKAFDVLLNPLSIISRTNPSQVFETALGKIASRTGVPYKVPDFRTEEEAADYVLNELRKNGMDDATEDVIDSMTGRKIPGVLVGNRFFMKLHHLAETKAQGRGIGRYTADLQPAKGGEDGAKILGLLELHGVLSHGATHVAADAKNIRGQANPEFWTQFMSGYPMPTTRVPHVYEKFINQLKSGGINVIRDNSHLHIMALTDSDIDRLAGDREITNADTVDWRDNESPVAGGLFDPGLTGGLTGRRWSMFRLTEPLPNPVMEKPIRLLLGLTEPKFLSILAGKEQLHGMTGPRAIAGALRSLDLNKELERARQEISGTAKTKRDAAVRRLGYIKSAIRLNQHPSNWLMTKVPVLPPIFRPIGTMGPKKLPLVADPNYLYQELFDANKSLAQMQTQVDDVSDERLAVYSALKGVVGLGDPIRPKNQERRVKGVLNHVFGSSPKWSTVQSRLLSTTMDLVGRGVVTPDPNLDMDQIGLPEDKAWEVYRPFVVRRLVQQGMSRLQAAQASKDRRPEAKAALLKEMNARPVIYSRAPALHRYSVMAAWPRLTSADTIRTPALVNKGFGLDHDGDAMNFYVPVSDKAVKDAVDKMLPSRNLFSVAAFKAHYLPQQEYLGGLYAASAKRAKVPERVFATPAAALAAYRRGEINADHPIAVAEK